MISWIQRSLQQHFKWLFLLLLAVVIISFVFITNASTGLGRVAKQAPARPFFGINLTSPEDSKRLMGDASISASLQGLPVRSEDQLEQYALQRQAALHLADQLNLPAPTEAELVQHVQGLRMFTDMNGKFDPKRYSDFRDSLKTNPQIREADVTRVIAHDVVYRQVLKLLSGPGYVLPSEVQAQLNRIDATWTIEAINVDFESFKPSVEVTDESLSQFFEYNRQRYEIPAKVGVSYIDFPAEAYADKVSVSEVGLRSYYEANQSRFKTGEKTDSTDTTGFEAVRGEVEKAYRLERARTLALRAAADLAVALHENPVAQDKLPEFLEKQNLTIKKLAPFNADNMPAELGTDRRVAFEALKTGAQKPYSEPIDTGRGAALLVWNETIDARIPELAEVKERVTADFLDAEKRKLFAESGRALRSAIETGLKAGDPIAKAVESAAKSLSLSVTTKTWSSFALTAPPVDFDYTAYGAMEGLQKGELSQMITSGSKGLILYAADKQLPEADPSSPKFTDMRERLANFTATNNGGATLAALVEAELSKFGPIDTP